VPEQVGLVSYRDTTPCARGLVVDVVVGEPVAALDVAAVVVVAVAVAAAVAVVATVAAVEKRLLGRSDSKEVRRDLA